MASMRRKNRCLVILSFLVVSWLGCINVSLAVDSLTVGQVLRDGEFLESPNKRFQLLFFDLDDFTPGYSSGSSSRYLGIHFTADPRRMVWVANRSNPLTDMSGNLTLTHDGNFVVNDYGRGTFITIYAAQAAANAIDNTTTTLSATLLDTGNLVLALGAGKRIVWQSFDYPFDIWLPGMKLGLFNSSSTGQTQQQHLSRFLASRVSPVVPSIGAFTLGIDVDSKELVNWQRGVVDWRSGMWNGFNFTNFPDPRGTGLFNKLNFSYVSNESQSYFTYTDNNNLSQYIELRSSGEIYLFEIGFSIEISLTQNHDYVSRIEYISCDADQLEDRSRGCANPEPEPSGCQLAGDMFYQTNGTMENVLYDLNNVSLGISDCRDICMKNCSCNAYTWMHNDGTGCIFYQGSMRSYPADQILHIRNSTLVSGDNPRKKQLWLAIGGPVASLFIVISVSLLCFLRWRNRNFTGNNRSNKDWMTLSSMHELKIGATVIDKISNGKKDHELPLFTLSSIEIATNNFSDANKIGQGGFGLVYKGILVDGQEIAVKRLSRSSVQGLEEFKNEVLLISRLQHRNLVSLLGCCTQGGERILIYEYLPNKSLDSFLFDATRRALLDWEMRVHIIEGIAQGIQYLHKYSRLKIIHRDLKISNILLDGNMNPKISDFGTARIFGDNESQERTKRVIGTYGYMPPEYALNGLFSVKSDVFSFGVMMLEIISGKKNTGFYHPDRALNLLGYAWDLWKEGKGLEIMDHALVETRLTSEAMRYIQVGFLCVQESAADRPTISEVVSMLCNEMIVIPAPKQPAFSAIVSVNHTNGREISKPCSINDVTISEVECR